jgi:predicted dehydrogenase
MSRKKVSRRRFVGDVAAAGLTFTIVPRHVLGGKGYTAPSDIPNVAAIGVGGKGRSDIDGIRDAGGVISAICDVDWDYAHDAFIHYPKATRWRDYREMLDKAGKSIDAVTIATPDHSHAAATILALRNKKAVYCQKPLAHSLGEVRSVMAEAKKATGVATQMGNQGHAGEGTRQIREWVEAGAIGPVREVHYWTNRPIWPQGIDRPVQAYIAPPSMDWNLWIGPAPDRPYAPAYAPFSWRGWWDFGCGALGDMACHGMDAAFWALDLGYPRRIEAEATTSHAETAPKASRITYWFPAKGNRGEIKVVWRDGGIWPPKPDILGPDDPWPRKTSAVRCGWGTVAPCSRGCTGRTPSCSTRRRTRQSGPIRPPRNIPARPACTPSGFRRSRARVRLRCRASTATRAISRRWCCWGILRFAAAGWWSSIRRRGR